MTNNAIHLNGINGIDGEYLMPELTIKQISRLAQGDKLETAHFQELKARHEAAEESFGVAYGIDPEDLSQAGWGVILPHGIDPSIREAISPLLMHRRSQAGDVYKEYSGPEGYRPQDSARV